ncbi:MAG: hypothetical protein KFF73_02880 [Cyclobacteriaceae bacterium]|nr:hypothetical protein [Cyclobacteriaceae bacterium]
MKKVFSLVLVFILVSFTLKAQTVYYDQSREGFLVFHKIRTDSGGNILPWYHEDPGISYDHVIGLVWGFWNSMRRDVNGLPYYMNHQVWRPENDPRGLGGDQLNMALSSWRLLYMYTGNEAVRENMKFIADYYLTHSLSPPDAAWPDIPFPYNTLTYSGYYDGDMVIGKDYAQPDKAGNFGNELIHLYKITGKENYLKAAVAIANTLAGQTREGDADHSPLPFKVNVFTGEIGILKSNRGDGSVAGKSSYTTNWVGTLQLWTDLILMEQGNIGEYRTASLMVLAWMKAYPLKTNKWGPFFEDIPGWSDTQINAVTFARYMMLNPDLFPDWETAVRGILDWVYEKLGNSQWAEYGVKVVNEQTVYLTPGNSHTSRQAAAELLYASLTGDQRMKENAVRQLNWATYMVDMDGKNCYPRDEVWLTDGYGDYVRHFIRAMAAEPSLAPSGADHILHSTSMVIQADYAPDLNKRLGGRIPEEELDAVRIVYRTFDAQSTETIRMKTKPAKVTLWNEKIPERMDLNSEGWTWQEMNSGGLLKVRHDNGNMIKIYSE